MIQSLRDENETLKNEINKANSHEKPSSTKSKVQNSNAQTVNSAKNTIGKWINACGKGNLIKDSDIEDLAGPLSKKGIAKKAVNELRQAKQYYKERKGDSAKKQKECFEKAKKELEKI